MRSMHVTDALSAYVDEALNEGERVHVERHLETCEDCRRHLSALRDLVTAVRSVEPVAAPGGFRAEVRSRVQQIAAPPAVTRRWPSFAIPWRALGAAAAVLVIGIFVMTLLRTEGPVAMREMGAPGEDQGASQDRLRSSTDQRSAEAPAAPEVAERTIPKQRPSVVRNIIRVALSVLTLGALAWLAVRGWRLRRAW